MPKPATSTQRDPLQSPAFQLKDETIEQWIRTGEQPGLLEDYFGEEAYRELREMAMDASTRKVRGGPRVLILPGIMGSKLGRPRPLVDDVIWIDPVDIAAGNLSQLALNNRPSQIQAVGVVLFAYLRLKLKLVMSGFDAAFFPFDWRYGIDHLAKVLVKRLEGETALEVHLVAHSMGGLVTRAALNCAVENTGAGRVVHVPAFVSISTPWNGDSRAAEGVKQSPVVAPSWEDMAPASPFLEGLPETPVPPECEYDLLFSHHSGGVFRGESNDGSVAVSSVLSMPIQRQARHVMGFDETHTGILRSPDVAAALNAMLTRASDDSRLHP